MIHAPKNKPTQIVSNPVRDPINRHTALLMRKASWIEQPLPEEPNMELSRLRQENSDLKKNKLILGAELAASHAKLQKTKRELDKVTGELKQYIAAYEQKISTMQGEGKAAAEKELRKFKVIDAFTNP